MPIFPSFQGCPGLPGFATILWGFCGALHARPARWYDFRMKTVNTTPALDRLVSSLGECLTPESARRLLALKADPDLQARVDLLAGRSNQGLLTPEERAEYGNYVTFGRFVAILKSKARQLLANSKGE
jgi:hypothetical protein